jgi:two-component system sensor histidine kinase KdpD
MTLNDVVADHPCAARDRPGFVFDRADAIELVDITPDDLIQRLKEGRSMSPAGRARAGALLRPAT